MRIFWLILCLFALPVSAEVFTYVDAQGNRVYTDQPRGNAKRVPIATSNRMSANPTAAAPISAAKKVAEQPLFHYDMLRILVPEPDATIRSNAGEVIVSVTSEPGLQHGPSLSPAARRPAHCRTGPESGVPVEQHRPRQPQPVGGNPRRAGSHCRAHRQPAFPHATHLAGAETPGQTLRHSKTTACARNVR